MGHGQPHAGAFPGLFRGEKRIENPVNDGRIDPRPGIAHPQVQALPGLGAVAQRTCRAGLRPKADLQNASRFPQGMRRIGAQIHDDLLDLGGFRQDGVRSGTQGFVDGDIVGNRGPDELERLLDERPHVKRMRALVILAAKRQDLQHEVPRPAAGRKDMAHPPGEGAFRIGFAFYHLGETHDNTENIVEIMGNAASQGPDGLHLLALAQTPLQILALSDVMGHKNGGQGRVVGVRQRRGGDEKLAPKPGNENLPGMVPTVGHGQNLPRRLSWVIRQVENETAFPADDIPGGDAQPVGHGHVEPADFAIAINDDHEILDGVEGSLPFALGRDDETGHAFTLLHLPGQLAVDVGQGGGALDDKGLQAVFERGKIPLRPPLGAKRDGKLQNFAGMKRLLDKKQLVRRRHPVGRDSRFDFGK